MKNGRYGVGHRIIVVLVGFWLLYIAGHAIYLGKVEVLGFRRVFNSNVAPNIVTMVEHPIKFCLEVALYVVLGMAALGAGFRRQSVGITSL